jgi:hypothetical protein
VSSNRHGGVVLLLFLAVAASAGPMSLACAATASHILCSHADGCLASASAMTGQCVVDAV